MIAPIQSDARHQAQDRLEALLLDGLEGKESELDARAWAEIHEEAREQWKLRCVANKPTS